MTYEQLEELGLKTVATDTNSFVSKTTEEYVWLEVFYCREDDYLQIMRAIKGNKGEVIRNTLLEGKGNLDYIKQFLK